MLLGARERYPSMMPGADDTWVDAAPPVLPRDGETLRSVTQDPPDFTWLASDELEEDAP